MNFQKAIQAIQNKLNNHTPHRLNIPQFTPAAVLIPFFNINNDAYILFTLRTNKVEHHKGQVSFPGGAWESQDISLEITGLRETREEVGIPEETISIIGQLDDFPTISDFLVTPFVATIPYPYPHSINQAEVAKLLEIPLEIFLTDRFFEVKETTYQKKKFPVYYYYYGDITIWGITGFILHQLIELVFEYNPAK